MRTSVSQFHLLVEWMERNGDLSKPTEGPQGRASNYKSWSELTEILNSDATGDTKTAEKWRKVWSDIKNNSKKKAARIHRAGGGTGGGPASKLKLSDLEQRILSIIRPQAATGFIDMLEIGLDQEHCEQREEQRWVEPSTGASTTQSLLEEPVIIHLSVLDEPGTSHNVLPSATLPANETLPPVASLQVDGENTQASIAATQHATPSTPRRRLLRNMVSPAHRRRTRTQTQSELARQAFVNSDSEWRALQCEQQRENVRLRERELLQQQQWLDLFQQFIGLGNRYMNYLENK